MRSTLIYIQMLNPIKISLENNTHIKHGGRRGVREEGGEKREEGGERSEDGGGRREE